MFLVTPALFANVLDGQRRNSQNPTVVALDFPVDIRLPITGAVRFVVEPSANPSYEVFRIFVATTLPSKIGFLRHESTTVRPKEPSFRAVVSRVEVYERGKSLTFCFAMTLFAATIRVVRPKSNRS